MHACIYLSCTKFNVCGSYQYSTHSLYNNYYTVHDSINLSIGFRSMPYPRAFCYPSELCIYTGHLRLVLKQVLAFTQASSDDSGIPDSPIYNYGNNVIYLHCFVTFTVQ